MRQLYLKNYGAVSAANYHVSEANMINNCRRKKSSKTYFCSGLAIVCTVVFIVVFMLIARDCMAADIDVSGNLTPEEQKLLILAKQVAMPDAKQNPDYDNYKVEYHKYLDHYLREGCKATLSGKWELQGHKDIIYIVYNDKYKVFEGILLERHHITFPNGSLFLKFFFPKDVIRDSFFILPVDGRLDSYNATQLRRIRRTNCQMLEFRGKEFWYNREQNYDVVIKLRDITMAPVDTMAPLDRQPNILTYDIEKVNQHLVFIRTN